MAEETAISAVDTPKIFISYRWSNPDHEEWVLRLATSLRESGIDARLDKWHLKEGQDTLTFMESMVNDHTVKKVLLICDSGYVERANNREGGVGTEAQIISAEVYKNTDQDKFAAVVVQLDDLGNPLLPTYMNTRLYFDMSSIDAESINFERIVRWIFDQPFHALPPLGVKPDFVGKTYATGSTLFSVRPAGFGSPRQTPITEAQAVLWSIADEAQSFHLELTGDAYPAQTIYKSVKELRPVSENAYKALRQLVAATDGDATDIIHRFFESLLRSWDQIPTNSKFTAWDNDLYQYFVHDLFVSFVAICLEARSFKLLADLLSMPYFKPKSHDSTGEAVDYSELRPYAESLESFGKSQGRASLHADLLNEGHEHSIVSQVAFMEADLTLHLRGILAPALEWYPISGIYLTGTYGALPTYVRAKSTKLYERLRPILMDVDANHLRTQLAEQASAGRQLKFVYRTLSLPRLTAAQELATVS